MAGVYDAIVVGAGPAGATAAREMAARGISVLLLESKKLPRDKPCGGGLTPRAWKHLAVPIDDLVLARSSGVRLQFGHRFSAQIRAEDAQIWMVRRREFDMRLAQDAVHRGVDLHDGEAATGVEPGSRIRVTSHHDCYEARVLIGADGAESRVARWLELTRPQRWMVGLEAEVAARDGMASGEAIVDLAVPWGYAWAFPKGDCYNVGVGTFSRAHSPALRKLLDLFADEMRDRLAGPVKAVGHRIPTGLVSGPLHRENALIAGDAAGVADPFFAEGISYSLFSGKMAAKIVAEFLSGARPDLSAYTSTLNAVLRPDVRPWLLTAAIVHRFPEPSVRFLARSRWLRHLVERTIAGEVGSARLSNWAKVL